MELLKGNVQKAKSSVIPVSTHGAMKCQLEGECKELVEICGIHVKEGEKT